MMNYGQHVDRLIEEVPGMARDEGERRVNRAYRMAAEGHGWSIYLKRFTLLTEASYDTGTLNVTVNNAAVTLSGGAWTTSWVTAPSMRRILIQGRSEPYDVTAMGSTTTGTLGDVFAGASNTVATYSLYRDVYPLPSDCGNAKLLVIYDPANKRRLWNFNQPEFLQRRNDGGGAGTLGTPECFMVAPQTAEVPPRSQIELFPASDVAEVLHGYYFRRPAFMTADADYPDWPAEYQDIIWLLAAIEYYESPRHFTPRYLDALKPRYMMLWKRMKAALDGDTAIDRDIKEMGSQPSGGFGTNWRPNWRVG